jgi:predicted nucleic acid-binding protein
MADRLSVFLDTNILVEYLRGSYPTLLSEQTLKRVKFAVNPIVLQELLLIADADKHSDRLEQVKQLVDVLPIDFQHVEAFLPKVKELRNRVMHSNDILIVTSAANCDLLISNDKDLKQLSPERPEILTADEFFARLGGK